MNANRIFHPRPTSSMRQLGLYLLGLNTLILVCWVAGVGIAVAQSAGLGAIQGTVTDPTGAVISNAVVTATDVATGIVSKRKTSSAGLYTITPLTPDSYTVTVTAPGFKIYRQQNIVVNGLSTTGLNLSLALGSESQTVTVTQAPPVLQTTDATISTVIDNATFEALPDIMNGQQRDPTAFASLAPGAQDGARAPIFSGTGNYLAEVYVDGIPTTTSNQQGDNRTVSNSIPIEAVDQLQSISSAPSAEYQGAGAINFTTKSGGKQYHGVVADFVRNTMFDTWGFTAPAATKLNGQGVTVPAGKPVEHQNEFVAAVGGPIPFTRQKAFFFVTYDQYHGRNGVNPAQETIPTTLMRTGNFSELLSTNASGITTGQIYDPLSTAACTANNSLGTPCRYQYGYGPGGGKGPNGNPVLTSAPVNVIPASEISAISQYEEKFLPAPTSSGIANNYLAGSGVSGYDNHEMVAKVDYQITDAQRISFVYTHGVRQSVGYGATLPLPYTSGDTSAISPTIMILEHSIVFTPHLVNQIKYGFSRFPQPVSSPTFNVAPYRAGPDIGIGNLPNGQAADAFPGTTFAANTQFPTAITTWTEAGASDATHNVVPNAYTLVDNLEWDKGRHSITFGLETQWLQDNTSSQSSPSGIYTQAFSANSTANFSGASLASNTNGYAYASFMLGAVNSAGTSIQAFSETGGRYHPWSPYVQDNFKVTPKLTVNLGLRYDYLPPYHEVQDRFSFFNPNANNSLTGTPGQLEFAGNRGSDISCQCRTPVHTYWKNFGPRLGAAYSINNKTVVRAGFAIAYSRAGGVGGRGGDSAGTGQGGFTANLVLPPAVSTGISAGPSFYLNNSAAFQAAGLANTNFGGPGFVLPTPTTPSATALTNGIGNYVNAAGKYVTAGGAPAYADPYLSGRAPTFNFYNLGLQRAITPDLTISVTYAGSQSHFVGGAPVSGFWSGELDPKYIATLGSVVGTDNTTNILNSPATPANIAIAMQADPSVTVPYAAYAQTQTGAPNASATIARMLRPYPQYSSPPSPEWDNIANISYNSLQIVLAQREYKGLSFTLNYTYSRNIGDDGTIRSAFPVPASVSSSGVALPGNDRADRSLTANDTPQILNIYGVDNLPFGKGHLGGNNFLVRNIIGGWSLSGIFTYDSGTPLLIVGSGCTTPSAGTCMPDINPDFHGPVRINGSFGKGITANHLNAIKYIDSNAFRAPQAIPSAPGSATLPANYITKIGDASRSAVLGLRNPSHYNLNMSVRRSFNITPERVRFIFGVDCSDVTNKVNFGGIGSTWSAASSSTLGEVTKASGNRDFQFSGRVTF
ncbi:MAG TPA: TonB-dependent receptor [Acidobacteriaceae bacterium]